MRVWFQLWLIHSSEGLNEEPSAPQWGAVNGYCRVLMSSALWLMGLSTAKLAEPFGVQQCSYRLQLPSSGLLYAASCGNFLPTFRDDLVMRCAATSERNYEYLLGNILEESSSPVFRDGSLKSRNLGGFVGYVSSYPSSRISVKDVGQSQEYLKLIETKENCMLPPGVKIRLRSSYTSLLTDR